MTKRQADETFGNFDFARALEFLGLFPYAKWELDIAPLAISEVLKINLQRAERQVTTGSNEWEQRLFMELIFLEVLGNHNLRMWQEKQINAGKTPFRGKADFVFTPYQAQFKLPYIILSEAKKDNFEQGWGQCLMGIKASQMINEKDGYKTDMYGIVSSGKIWEFGKYTLEHKFYKTDSYSMNQLGLILAILKDIFITCEEHIDNATYHTI